MDTQKQRKTNPIPGLSPENAVAGGRQLRKALLCGSVRCVYLARNADPAVTEPVLALCEEQQVEYRWVPTMADLGKACGIEVGAAVAASVEPLDSNGCAR